MKGKIIQNLSGLYYVLSDTNDIVRCRPRGIFRKNKVTLSAGDNVVFEMIGADEGVIGEILPRKNNFIRPNVSNVDMICYVISARFPEPDTYLIDKMTVLAALKNVEILLILNKVDLDDDASARRIVDIYKTLGFSVLVCSALQMNVADKFLEMTAGKTVVLTGNTGVGKSSILNTLGLGVSAKVSEISEKLGRGRHTTREVTFYLRENGGLIGDTPGFGNVDIALESELKAETLQNYFAEFVPWKEQCRFADCSHSGESGCIICDKVLSGDIPKTRYRSYLAMLRALTERDQNIYK